MSNNFLYHLELSVSCSNGSTREGTFVDVATFTPSPTGISEGESFQLLVDGILSETKARLADWKRIGQSQVGYVSAEAATEDAVAVSRILTERVASNSLDSQQIVMLFLGPAAWRQSTLSLDHAVWFSVSVWKQQPSGGNDLLVRI